MPPRRGASTGKSSSPSRSPSPAVTSSKEKQSELGDVTWYRVHFQAGELACLRSHKYNCQCDSVICNSWFFMTLWDTIAESIIPMWMVPNMVTFLGAMCSYSVFGIAHLVQKGSMVQLGNTTVDITETWTPETKWNSLYSVYCTSGMFLLVAYNTLDNVDGKVARNRGMGTPLGQWMDHGCDAATMCLAMAALVHLMQLEGMWMMVCWVAGGWVWLVVAWEEHYTHCLRMDYFSSDESEYLAVALGIYTCYAGPQIWSSTHYTDLVLGVLSPEVAALMPFSRDNELCLCCMLIGQVMGAKDSFFAVKRLVNAQVKGGEDTSGVAGWWSEEYFDAL